MTDESSRLRSARHDHGLYLGYRRIAFQAHSPAKVVRIPDPVVSCLPSLRHSAEEFIIVSGGFVGRVRFNQPFVLNDQDEAHLVLVNHEVRIRESCLRGHL